MTPSVDSPEVVAALQAIAIEYGHGIHRQRPMERADEERAYVIFLHDLNAYDPGNPAATITVSVHTLEAIAEIVEQFRTAL